MSFQFEKLTTKGREVVANAQSLASGKGHPEIQPLHLLECLLKQSDGIVPSLLNKISVPVDQLAGIVASELERLPSSTGSSSPNPSRELQSVLQLSLIHI